MPSNSLQQPELYNRMLVVLNNGQNDEALIRAYATDIKDKLEKNDVAVLRMHMTKTNEHPMASTVQAILGILGALGILILFLSSSLIANTLSSLLNQHLRHIGVMKLVGARQKQVIILYITLIIGFSLLALALAVPLGGQGAYGLSQFIADKLNFRLLGYRLIPFALIIQIVIGLAVPILVGLLPVIRGSRISVQRALSNDVTGEEKVQTTSQAIIPIRPVRSLLPGADSQTGYSFSTSTAHLSAEYFPSQGQACLNPVYPHHGGCDLHRGLQCPNHAA